jgi:hypothetical protein
VKLHEYEPVGEEPRPRALHREGSAVLTCTACGCRLTAREPLAGGGGPGPDAAWRHYPGGAGDRDARGCRVHCMDEPHRIALAEQITA